MPPELSSIRRTGAKSQILPLPALESPRPRSAKTLFAALSRSPQSAGKGRYGMRSDLSGDEGHGIGLRGVRLKPSSGVSGLSVRAMIRRARF